MTFPEREFETFNNRIFYACQAVLVNREDNIETKPFGRLEIDNDFTGTLPTDGFLLDGVQSIAVSHELNSESLQDIGRFQRMYHYYGKQLFTISIERVITDNGSFFYEIDPTNYNTGNDGYVSSHILNDQNLGTGGYLNDNNRTLRNYDITLVYGSDGFSGIGGGLYKDTDPITAGIQADSKDKTSLDSVTYRSCLLTSVSYSMSVDGELRETITLVTRLVTRNSEVDVEDYTNLPEGWIINQGDPARTPEGGFSLRRKDMLLLPPESSPKDYESILPYEVLRMFQSVDKDGNKKYMAAYDPLTETLINKQILGIQSIEVEINIEYSELQDVGIWRGSFIGEDAANANSANEEGFVTSNYFVNLPIQITTSFTGIARQQYFTQLKLGPTGYTGFDHLGFPLSDGPFTKMNNPDTEISGLEAERYPHLDTTEDDREWNRVDRKIRITHLRMKPPTGLARVPNYYVMDLGARNYLTGIETSGGDVDGGNVEVTMTYQNDCSDIVLVKHTEVKDLSYPELPF